MKKLILCGSALLLTLGLANAQGWSAKGVHDDFASATPYDSVVWSADANNGASTMAITRPGNGTLKIAASNIGKGTPNQYPTFRVNFSPNATSPSPLNLKTDKNANIVFDIENNSSNLLFAKIELEDANGIKSNYEPNISDVTSNLGWGDQVNGKYPRKANNGFVLAGNARGTFTIDLSSVEANLGGLTRTGWVGDNGCTKDGPSCGPVTAYQIDPTKIVAVIFTVNYNDGSYILSMGTEGGDHTDDYIIDPLDAASYTGNIIFHDFKIGSAVLAGMQEAIIDNSLSVYPNPADEALTVSFDAKVGANVSLTDIVGNPVYTTTSKVGSNKINVNTSDLSAGIYILKIATESGMVARKVTIK
jgi:hypothetical protein